MPGALGHLQTLPVWAVIGLELARSGLFSPSTVPPVCPAEPPRGILKDTLLAVRDVQQQLTLSRVSPAEDAPMARNRRAQSSGPISSLLPRAVFLDRFAE